MRRILLIVVILAVEFAALEGALRAYGGSEAAPAFQSLFVDDPRVGHRLVPGAHIRYSTVEFSTDIAINAEGVRDDRDIGPKAPNERRVVVLGDSLVLAVQVELRQTFCKLLEARLNHDRPEHQWRVIDAGVQGYGPVEDWLFYKNVVSAFHPDLVLVVIFAGNDATDAADHASWLDAGPAPAAATTTATSTRLRRLVRSSMVLQIVRQRIDLLESHFQSPTPERPLEVYLANPPPDIARGLAVSRRALGLIAGDAAAHGAATGVVLMPARFQLVDDDFAALAAVVRGAGGEMVRNAATERFRAALAPLGLPLVDLQPILAAQPDPAGLFFARNVHLTPRGHQVVAGALAEFLESSGLVVDR